MITLFVKGTPGQFFGKFIVLYSIKSKTRKDGLAPYYVSWIIDSGFFKSAFINYCMENVTRPIVDSHKPCFWWCLFKSRHESCKILWSKWIQLDSMSVIKSKNWLSMYDSRALSVRANQVEAVYSVFLKSPSRCCF